LEIAAVSIDKFKLTERSTFAGSAMSEYHQGSGKGSTGGIHNQETLPQPWADCGSRTPVESGKENSVYPNGWDLLVSDVMCVLGEMSGTRSPGIEGVVDSVH